MNGSPRRRPRGVRRLLGVCVLAISVASASCTVLTPRADPSRFFVLTPLADAAPSSGGERVASLGLGPIHLPRYLDRPEIVTRVGPNEVKPALFDYWGGSLSRQFETVLAQNLQTLVARRPDSALPVVRRRGADPRGRGGRPAFRAVERRPRRAGGEMARAQGLRARHPAGRRVDVQPATERWRFGSCGGGVERLARGFQPRARRGDLGGASLTAPFNVPLMPHLL